MSPGGRIILFIIFFAIIAIAVVTLIVVGVFVKGKRRNTQSQKICPQCGKPLKDGKSFCTNCGAKAEG